MLYDLPDGYNFYEELYNASTVKNEVKNEVCLINGELLDMASYIQLECGHKFNYLSLLNDTYITKQNYQLNPYLSVVKLKEHQLQCPYCRQIQDNILPYVKEFYTKRLKGVNYPSSFSMGKNKCDYILKNGKNKGSQCGSKSYWKKCSNHYKHDLNMNISVDNSTWSRDNLSKYTIAKLRELAKHHKLVKYYVLKKNDLISLLLNIK